MGEVEHKPADAVLTPVVDILVPEEVIVGKVERTGPREVALEQQAIGVSLFAAYL